MKGRSGILGISECSAASLRRAHKVHPITAVQVEYSPFSLEIETPQIDLLNTARELGVAVVAYSPPSRGLLSGKVRSRDQFTPDDWRLGAPRFQPENFARNLDVVDALHAFATEKGVTAAQLVLAWLLAQGGIFFRFPGRRGLRRLLRMSGLCRLS